MKKKKQVSRKVYDLLNIINIVLLVAAVAMLFAGIGGENPIYWLYFGISAVVYIIWTQIFAIFELSDEEKAKDEAKKKAKEEEKLKIEQEKAEYNNSVEGIVARLNNNSEALTRIELKRIEEEGLIVCSETALALINGMTYNENAPDNEFTCPICGSVVECDASSYFVVDKREVDEAIEGVYVPVNDKGEVKQAYQKVTKTIEKPAVHYTCPHCEWEKYTSELGNAFLNGKLYPKLTSDMKLRNYQLTVYKFFKRKPTAVKDVLDNKGNKF